MKTARKRLKKLQSKGATENAKNKEMYIELNELIRRLQYETKETN
jgi:hypothetical protein